MATINKNNTNKNTVELRKELNAQGCTVENVYVNDKPFVCVGYVSEQDKSACLKAIQTAIDSSENEYEAMQKLITNAYFTDKAIEPDEEIEIDGCKAYISYADKTLYATNGEALIDCKDLICELPKEACKEILLSRLHTLMAENDEDED